MRHRRAAAILSGIGFALLPLLGCATGQPDPESGPSDSGDCAIEVRNETNEALSVTAGGTEVRQLGSVEPGGRLRFHEDCGVDDVTITATVTQTSGPAIGAEPGRARPRLIQRTVGTWPGHVVRVPLRFPEQVRRSGGGIEGVPPAPGGGVDSPPPPGTTGPAPPDSSPEGPPGS